MMKRGIVVEGRGNQVRVQFEDHDGMISPWLDCAQPTTIGKRSYRRPKAGELVRCFLDDKGETGEVLYAIYNDQNPAPADDDDLIYEEMPDGSTMEWKSGSIKITHASGIVVTLAGGKAVIDGNVEISQNLKVSGNLEVEGSTDLKSTKINGITQVGN